MTPLLSTADVCLLSMQTVSATSSHASLAQRTGRTSGCRITARTTAATRAGAASSARIPLPPSAGRSLLWPQPMQIPIPLRRRAPVGGGAVLRRHGRAWHRPAHPRARHPLARRRRDRMHLVAACGGSGVRGWMRGATVWTLGLAAERGWRGSDIRGAASLSRCSPAAEPTPRYHIRCACPRCFYHANAV